MKFGIVKKFFDTTVILVVRGHWMQGTLINLSHTYGEDVVGLESLQPSDGYVKLDTALVEVSSIDIIRRLTVVTG